MKIVIAPDSYKGSLTAKAVSDAMEKGVLKYFPRAEVVKVPMADGGEGTLETIVEATQGELFEVFVMGPLGEPVKAAFGIFGEKRIAVIETASASGLTLIPEERKNPLMATTYGIGQLIKSALDKDCRNFIIGIGGSATNDGGVGMAQALGVSFLDRNGKELDPGGGRLGMLERIRMAGIDPRIKECRFNVACDVNNPLCGENGASEVFGPQKGATPEMVRILDDNLRHLAKVIKRDIGKDIISFPGAGAAGGLGGGLLSFCDAKLNRGIEIILAATEFKKKMAGANLVITGEGQMDRQTVNGKTPYGVTRAACEMGIPAVAVVGSIGEGAEVMFDHGLVSVFSIVSTPQLSLEECFRNAEQLIADTTFRLLRALDVDIWQKADKKHW